MKAFLNHRSSLMKCCGLEISAEIIKDDGTVFAEWKCNSCGKEAFQLVGDIDNELATFSKEE